MITKMESKISNKGFKALFAIAVLMIFLTALVSADSLTVTSPSTLTESQNASFTITVSGTSEWNIVSPIFPLNINLDDGNGNTAVLRLTTSDVLTNLNSSDQVRVNVSVSSIDSNFILSSRSTTFTINAQNASNPSQVITSDVTLNLAKTYCEQGSKGSSLEITSVKDEQLDNTKDWEWGPRDNIELTVRVRNHNSSDVDSIVAYGLYDFKNDNFVLEDQESVTINQGDYEDVKITFQMPTSDLNEDSYRLYIKAYDDNEGENKQCTDKFDSQNYKSITIKREKNDIQVEKISVPETVQCGQPVDIKMDVVNLGKKDEKKVKVTLTNTELGLKQDFIVNSLNKGDSKSVNFNFLAPTTVKEGTYVLKSSLSFNYNSNRDSYDQSKSGSDISLKLNGNCRLTADDVQILVDKTNAIQSGGKAGEELVIKASIVNTGTKSATFNVKATGYDSWAKLGPIEPQTFTLEPATTRDVLLHFNVTKEATGDNNFKLSLESNGEKLKEQTVSVPIQPKSGFNFTGNSIINSDNWYLWGIGLVNVILIILIIVIAVKVSRR